MSVFFTRRGKAASENRWLDYLESTGTQWIDTEVPGTQDVGFVIDFATDTPLSVSGFGAILGCVHSGANRIGIGTYPDRAGGQLVYGSYIYDPAITVGKRMTVSLLNGVATTPNGTTNIASTTFSVGATIALFATKRSSGAIAELSKTKIYSCQIYNNSVLVRDLRPCYDPEGVACMYDKVEKKYYYNAGTGEFIAGGETNGGDSGVITFTVAGTAYIADPGMTWAQWINSSYNTSGFSELHGGVMLGVEGFVYYNGAHVVPTDAIITNAAYTLE